MLAEKNTHCSELGFSDGRYTLSDMILVDFSFTGATMERMHGINCNGFQRSQND
jgi:hypothetical protein